MPSAFKPVTVGLLLVGLLFAGCAGPGSSSGGAASNLVRTIDVDIDPSVLGFTPSGTPEQMLAQFADAAFEYKHAGGSLATTDIKVRYQTTGGIGKTSDLSKFTSKSTVADGQTVRIAPSDMSVFSPMELTSGETTLANRTGLDREWLTAVGVPLPIASSKTGKAVWTMDASAALDVSVRDFSFEEDGVRNQIDEFSLAMQADANARVELQTTAGSSQKVTLRLPELTETASIDMSIKGKFGGRAMDATASIDAQASVDGRVDLTFEDGALSRAGVEGKVSADVTFDATGFPEETPEDVHFSESLPYMEEEVPDMPGLQDPTLVAFIERIWNLDLMVGDRFSLRFESPPTAGPGVTVEYSTQVVGAEERKVGSSMRPTLRITDHFAFETDAPEAAELQKLSYDFTYWVDQQSYLPVYQQGSISRTFTPDDFPELFANLEPIMASAGGQLPDDLTVTITTDATLQMTQYSGDFSRAAILTTGATQMVIPAAAVVFVLVNNLGKGAETAPSMGIVQDRTAGRLTVASTEPGASWDEYTVEASKALRFDLNGAAGASDVLLSASMPSVVDYAGETVTAADYIAFCGSGAAQTNVVVELVHMPTNTMVYSATFPTIAKCA